MMIIAIGKAAIRRGGDHDDHDDHGDHVDHGDECDNHNDHDLYHGEYEMTTIAIRRGAVKIGVYHTSTMSTWELNSFKKDEIAMIITNIIPGMM